MLAIEKMYFVSIWMVGMPSICLVNITSAKNLFVLCATKIRNTCMFQHQSNIDRIPLALLTQCPCEIPRMLLWSKKDLEHYLEIVDC